MSWRSHLLVVTLVAGGCVVAWSDVAAASVTVTLPTDTQVHSGVTDAAGNVGYTNLLSVTLTAGPDQPRSIFARFVVYRPADATGVDVKHMAEGRLHCFAADGNSHSSVTTTQNIWREGTQMTLVSRMLFVPSVAGMYTCMARARVSKCRSGETTCTGRYLVYKAGAGNTELVYASPTWAQFWGLANDSKHPPYTVDGDAYVAATHIHSGIPPGDYPSIGDEEYVAKEGVTIPDGPTTFNSFSGVHMTSCFYGDNGCFEGARWLGGPARETTSVVDLWIVANQVYADGTLCVQRVGPAYRLTILGDSHHQKANIVFNGIPIADCGGSRRFAMKTYVERVSGNPIRVERGDLVGDRFSGYSHGGVYY